MSIIVVDETTPMTYNDAPLTRKDGDVWTPEHDRLTRARRGTPPAGEARVRYADGAIPIVDDRMRLPSFMETCPHISDKIIPLNGGRFNVDHYLRVIRAKAEIDPAVAMALTVRTL